MPRAIDRLLLEQPKPPWLVAWIEFGVHLFGRRNVDALILFSTVVPYGFLDGRRDPGWPPAAGAHGQGFLALVCLASSPLSLAFGGKVMVETYPGALGAVDLRTDRSLFHCAVTPDGGRRWDSSSVWLCSRS